MPWAVISRYVACRPDLSVFGKGGRQRLPARRRRRKAGVYGVFQSSAAGKEGVNRRHL